MRLKVSNVCQVFNKEEFIATMTRDGITFTNNGDGTFTINGTATANVFMELFKSGAAITGFNINHKYLICGNLSDTIQIFETLSGNGTRHYEDSIFTCVKSEGYLDLRIIVGTTATNYVFRPQLFDLTEMYGEGNEPTTVAQFRQDFPNEMYEYSPVCWKKFRRLKYINAENSYLTLNRGKYIANKEPVQLLDKSKYPATTTNKGITITNNGDGSIMLNGTATSEGEIYSLQYINLINGHKYFIYDNQGGSFANIVFTLDGVGSAANHEGNIWTCNITSGPLRRNTYFYVATGTVISNKVYKPQLFDLTAMYGAGNEPTTVAQFRTDYPNELYDYNPYNAITFR